MGKRVVCVARDIAPSSAFERLKPVLEERGFKVFLIVGGGKPLPHSDEEIVSAVAGADIVLLGMSSSKELAEPEIRAGFAALERGIPYGFYGDVRGCFSRARKGMQFGNLAARASFYLGVTEEDAEAARDVLPHAELFGTGNPLREEMAFVGTTRAEVRSKLNVPDGEVLILAPGGKFCGGNMARWATVMDSLAMRLARGKRDHLALALHPGDRTPQAFDREAEKELELYEELVSFSPVPTQLVAKKVLPTPDILPGSDIVIEFATSIGINAAYLGVPVISLDQEVNVRRFEQENGHRRPEVVDDGVAEAVGPDAAALAEAIGRLLTPEGFAPMRAKQEELYPKPKVRGQALRKMADAVEKMLD